MSGALWPWCFRRNALRRWSFWVQGAIRLQGLKSKPEYNGRVGFVHAYDESAERLHVLLSASETDPERWIKVKDENVVLANEFGLSDRRARPLRSMAS